MDTTISIQLPGLEVDFEGSEEFVREELRGFIEDVASIQGAQDQTMTRPGVDREQPGTESAKSTSAASDDPVASLAEEIGVERKDVVGAFAPENKEPYVRVDKYYWNAFKKNTPSTGPNAIASGGLVGTIMALWFDQLDRDSPTKDEVLQATRESDIRDKNIERSFNNTEWLKYDGTRVTLNPAKLDKALRVSQAFCLQTEIPEQG